MNTLMIWKFAQAPLALRVLFDGGENVPEWLALVPRAIYDADLDKVILEQALPGDIWRSETPDGDIVYAGSSAVCIHSGMDSDGTADIWEPARLVQKP